jgi:DNA-directed RNA polymerase specialized sigma24 family protein
VQRGRQELQTDFEWLEDGVATCFHIESQFLGQTDDLSLIYRAFNGQREELTWLASFLLANQELVDVCFLDAFEISIQRKIVFREAPTYWARRAVIQSAISMQESRIATLATIYQRHDCSHRQHASIAPEALKLLVSQSPERVLRMDVLCRFALALRGVEQYSANQSAAILGVSRTAIDAAYCAGLLALKQFAEDVLQTSEREEFEEA